MGTLLKEIDQIEEVVGLIKSEATGANKKDQTMLKTVKNEVKQEDVTPADKKVAKAEVSEKKQQSKGTGSKKRVAKKDQKEAEAEIPLKEKREANKEKKASQKSDGERSKSPQKEKAEPAAIAEKDGKMSAEEKS